MILVTVGTEKFPFNRLMQWTEALINCGFLNLEQDEVVVQFGACTILPNGTKTYKVLIESQFQSLIQQARVVISHCGEGTMNLLESCSQPYILVPRSRQFGEHVDDHQVEMAIALAAMGAVVAWSPADLVRFLADPYRVKMSHPESSVLPFCQTLEDRFCKNT
ncbi:glucosyl transferase [Neosynechococcus sphagnicola sy1]|uniref:Glucosyl transferase n=1 Tax=Neosynechococcus sphagnicola sy1 TaxID=1497020 RepID=A0A098TPK4_9CYAN|nr:glycosyltransferase [Neosynechococcus sphagnicola]KGF72763.1 glucosyl transferase [Neosynechococcus sphagnicola sy1]